MTPPSAGQRTPLTGLEVHHSGTVTGFHDSCPAAVRKRMASLGFVPGATVTKIRRAPLGDPCVYRVMDYEMCLRRREAAFIECDPQR